MSKQKHRRHKKKHKEKKKKRRKQASNHLKDPSMLIALCMTGMIWPGRATPSD